MSAAAAELVVVVLVLVMFVGAAVAMHGDKRERDRQAYDRASNRALRRELSRHD
jgi:uncharacterized membrane protein